MRYSKYGRAGIRATPPDPDSSAPSASRTFLALKELVIMRVIWTEPRRYL